MADKILRVTGTALHVDNSREMTEQAWPTLSYPVFTLGRTTIDHLNSIRSTASSRELREELLKDDSNAFEIALTDAEFDALSSLSTARIVKQYGEAVSINVTKENDNVVVIDVTETLKHWASDVFLMIDHDSSDVGLDVEIQFGSYHKRIGYATLQYEVSVYQRLYGVLITYLHNYAGDDASVRSNRPITRLSPSTYQGGKAATVVNVGSSYSKKLLLPVDVLGISDEDATTMLSFVSADVTALGQTASNSTVYRARTYRAEGTTSSNSFGDNAWHEKALVTGVITRRPDLDDSSAVTISDRYTTSVLSFVNQTDGNTYTVAIEGVYDFPNDEPAQPAPPVKFVVTRDNLDDVFEFNDGTQQVTVKVDNTTVQKGDNGLQLVPSNNAPVSRVPLLDVAGEIIAYVPVPDSNN